MSKFFLRWIDSWSDSENAQVGASSEYVIEKNIQWLRIIPFIFITYRLFSCILGGRILVRGCFYAGVLFSSHVCNYCFFPPLSFA